MTNYSIFFLVNHHFLYYLDILLMMLYKALCEVAPHLMLSENSIWEFYSVTRIRLYLSMPQVSFVGLIYKQLYQLLKKGANLETLTGLLISMSTSSHIFPWRIPSQGRYFWNIIPPLNGGVTSKPKRWIRFLLLNLFFFFKNVFIFLSESYKN